MNGLPQILLVEDDEDVRDAVGETLMDAGYQVSMAGNGALALHTLQSSERVPDLILLDLMMPVMDGEHFIEQFKKEPRFSEVPVILLTADANAVRLAGKLGVHGALRKPVRLEELLSTVERFANGRLTHRLWDRRPPRTLWPGPRARSGRCGRHPR